MLSLPHSDLVELIDNLGYPHAKIESSGADYALYNDRRRLDMMLFRVVEGSKTGLTVEITTEIRVGHHLRINPSESFLGIESGIVTVLGIVYYNDLGDGVTVPGILDGDILAIMGAERDGILDLMEGTEYYEEELRKLNNDPWIVYQYQGNDEYGGEWHVLPLEEFVGHTMHY